MRLMALAAAMCCLGGCTMLVHRTQVERSDPARELAGVQPDGPARYLGAARDAGHDGFLYDLTIAAGRRRLWLFLPTVGSDGARISEAPIRGGGEPLGSADVRFAVRSPVGDGRLPDPPLSDAAWEAWRDAHADQAYPTLITVEAWGRGSDAMESFVKFVRPADGRLAAVRARLDLRWVNRSHLDVGARSVLYPFAVAGDALLVVTLVVVVVVLSPAGL